MVTVNLMFNNDIFRSLLVNVYLCDYSFSYKKIHNIKYSNDSSVVGLVNF